VDPRKPLGRAADTLRFGTSPPQNLLNLRTRKTGGSNRVARVGFETTRGEKLRESRCWTLLREAPTTCRSAEARLCPSRGHFDRQFTTRPIYPLAGALRASPHAMFGNGARGRTRATLSSAAPRGALPFSNGWHVSTHPC